ncbi:EFR3 homolog cmp44E-like protein, partial [Tanacetum coccineum]
DIPIHRRLTKGTIRISQSKVPSPGADETASPSGDDRHGEAFPTATSLDAGQDRENIAKTSAMPHEASPRVTSLGGGEGSIQQKLTKLMEIVPAEEVYIEALQVKRPIIDWEVCGEGQIKYWKIVKVGDHTEVYQLFEEMLRKFDRDDLDKLWSLYIHDPLEWKLYDTCGVHHVSTGRGHEIFMLVEKDYPLTKGLTTVMLFQDDEMFGSILSRRYGLGLILYRAPCTIKGVLRRFNLEEMGVMSRRVLPVCSNLCIFCPSMRARSRQPVKRYKKLLAEIFPRSQIAEPNDRKIGKLCEYSCKNPLRIPKITDYLEQKFYKELRNKNIASVKVVSLIYGKLPSSCKEQMSLFASSLLDIVRTLLDQTEHYEIQIDGCQILVNFINNQVNVASNRVTQL